METRHWRSDLQTNVMVVSDESGIGHGVPIWFNQMRVHCVEGDGHAGFWRYDVGEYSVLLFRLTEIDHYTFTVQYDHDQFPLPYASTFFESHTAALTAAQEQIRQDGRGTRKASRVQPSSSGRFPCPYDVFPDALRVTRGNCNSSRTLLNADPFDVLIHAVEDVRNVHNAVLEFGHVPDGIVSSGPDFGVEYLLTFYQDDLPVLRIRVDTNIPQFLYHEDAQGDGAYWTTERFWSSLARLLHLSHYELFPLPAP